MGGIRREEMYFKDNKEIEQILEREIRTMFGLKNFNPEMLTIMRYEHAIPQYGAESKERFQTIEEIENQYKGLKIIGNLRDGIGMADRIKQACDVAKKLELEKF